MGEEDTRSAGESIYWTLLEDSLSVCIKKSECVYSFTQSSLPGNLSEGNRDTNISIQGFLM